MGCWLSHLWFQCHSCRLCLWCLLKLEIVFSCYMGPLCIFCFHLIIGTKVEHTPEFEFAVPKSCSHGPLSGRSSDFQAYLLLLNKIWVTAWNFQRTAERDPMIHFCSRSQNMDTGQMSRVISDFFSWHTHYGYFNLKW